MKVVLSSIETKKFSQTQIEASRERRNWAETKEARCFLSASKTNTGEISSMAKGGKWDVTSFPRMSVFKGEYLHVRFFVGIATLAMRANH